MGTENATLQGVFTNTAYSVALYYSDFTLTTIRMFSFFVQSSLGKSLVGSTTSLFLGAFASSLCRCFCFLFRSHVADDHFAFRAPL